MQYKKILKRTIPDPLKLSIAKNIEGNLFSKVWKCHTKNAFPQRGVFERFRNGVCNADIIFGGTSSDWGDANLLCWGGCVTNCTTFFTAC
jgi:hypothetical protein